jgi:hypothetical protein
MSVNFLCFIAKTVFNVKFKWVVQLCKNKSVRAMVAVSVFNTIEYYRNYLFIIHNIMLYILLSALDFYKN